MKATLNGIQLAFEDQGKGLPIVLLHGFPLNLKMWDPQVKELSPYFRVIALDLRGHGGSDAPMWHYTMEIFCEDIIGLLDFLRIEQAIMVGLSMGGYILFNLYRKYPERVKGLLFADTRASADTPEVRAGRFHLAQTAYQKGIQSVADAMIPKLLGASTMKNRAHVVEEVRKIITANSVAGIIGDLMAMSERFDATPLLPKIKCPTLVVVGDEDMATSPEEVKRWSSCIPGARFETIPKAGHLSNFENPDAFNRICLRFLNSTSSGR